MHNKGFVFSPDRGRDLPSHEGCQYQVGFVKLSRFNDQIRIDVQLNGDLKAKVFKLAEYPLGEGVEAVTQQENPHGFLKP